MTITLPSIVPLWLFIAVAAYPFYLILFGKVWDKFWSRHRVLPEGYIYLILRNDGIYKIGRTITLQERLKAHEKNESYKLIAAWPVLDVETYEKKALKLTERYFYREGNKVELRKMTTSQLAEFVFIFTLICEKQANLKLSGVIF